MARPTSARCRCHMQGSGAWSQSLALPCFSISSDTLGCSTPSLVISCSFCAPEEQCRDTGTIAHVGERIWKWGFQSWCSCLHLRLTPAVLIFSARCGWEHSPLPLCPLPGCWLPGAVSSEYRKEHLM